VEPYQSELLEVLAAQQPALTDHIVDVPALPVPNGVMFSRDELRQMVSGFFVLVREAIEGKSHDVRDMYVSTVFPGLRDSGTEARMMIAGSARTLFHVLHELLSRVSEPNRARARDLLTGYFSDYLGDMAAVWAAR
jgi:hypothetical protein